VLAEHDAAFIVVGGQAETLMGSSRVTYDVDLCYQAHDDQGHPPNHFPLSLKSS